MSYRVSIGLLVLASGLLVADVQPPREDVRVVASLPQQDFSLYPRWSQLTPEKLTKESRDLFITLRSDIQSLLKLRPEEMTMENTFGFITDFDAPEYSPLALIRFQSLVNHSPEWQMASQETYKYFQDYNAWLTGESGAWGVMQQAIQQDWAKNLSEEDQHIVDLCVNFYTNAGSLLSAEDKKILDKNIQELGRLEIQYHSNLQRSRDESYVIIEHSWQLFGLFDSFLQPLAQLALEKGYGTESKPQWLLPLHDDSIYFSVMQYCHVEETRKRLWEAHSKIAGEGTPYDNTPVVEAILRLRQENAELLGFESFADLRARKMMMGTAENATEFVDDMIELITPQWNAHKKMMLDLVSARLSRDISEIAPWNELYYLGLLENEKSKGRSDRYYNVFPFELTLNKLLRFYESMYGVIIKPVPTSFITEGETLAAGHAEVWHPSVRLYAVYDQETKAHLGSVYLDLLARPGKTQGALSYTLRAAKQREGAAHSPNLTTLIMNIPVDEEGLPYYNMMSDYVLYLMHEFGHVFHSICSDVKYCALTGSNMEQDFGEFPSTLFEKWISDPESAQLFATSSLSQSDLVEFLTELNNANEIREMWNLMDTLITSKLDLDIHTHYKTRYAGRNLQETCYELTSKHMMPVSHMQPNPLLQDHHTMVSGYGACLYSYILSDVLAEDAYARFKAEGVTNPKIGMEFRRRVLEPGASLPSKTLYRNFMGRDLEYDAYFERNKINK